MLAAQVLNAGLKDQRYDLQSLKQKYIDQLFPDGPIETIKHLTNAIVPMLKAEKLPDVAELEFSSLPAIVEMELQGVNLDIEKWGALGGDLTDKKEQLEKALYAELGDINLDNPKEIQAVLRLKGIDLPDTRRQTLMLHEDQHTVTDKKNNREKYQKNVVQGISTEHD